MATTETYDQWAARGHELIAARNRNMWQIGDWLLEGESRWGETYTQAVDLTQISYTTLATYAGVCRWYGQHTPYRAYADSLSFSHHKIAKTLPDVSASVDALYTAWILNMNREEFAEHVRGLRGDPQTEQTTTARQYTGSVVAVDNERGTVTVQVNDMAALDIGAMVTVSILVRE